MKEKIKNFIKRFSKEIIVALILAVIAAVLIEAINEKTGEEILNKNQEAIAVVAAYDKNMEPLGQGSGFFISSYSLWYNVFYLCILNALKFRVLSLLLKRQF